MCFSSLLVICPHPLYVNSGGTFRYIPYCYTEKLNEKSKAPPRVSDYYMYSLRYRLYTGSRIFLSRLPFTTWCQTISVEDLDSAYINVRYPDGSYKPTELTAEERSRLVSVLNHLQLADIKFGQLAHENPVKILFIEGQDIRFILEFYTAFPNRVRVLGNYQDRCGQLYNDSQRYIWIENEALMSVLRSL